MAAGVEILGLAAMAKALEELKGVAAGVDEGVKRGAETIAAGAKRRCRSATVAGDIHTEGGEIVSSNERAWIEEYGSGPRVGERGPHNFPARPYMRPAMDEDAGAAVEDVAAELRERLS